MPNSGRGYSGSFGGLDSQGTLILSADLGGQGKTGILSVQLLAGAEINLSDGGQIVLKNRKACGLLIYLALKPGHCETRERLTALLWSESAEEQARASLRQCIKQIRTAFVDASFHGFVAEREKIFLWPGCVRTDLADIADDIEHNRLDRALHGLDWQPDTMLADFESLDPSYTAWLRVVRRQWHNRITEGLEHLLRDPAQHTDERKRAAEQLIKIDPTHEEAYRYLMRNAAQQGNVAAALRLYTTLWNLLDADYDMEPSDDTQRLVAEIKLGTITAAPAQPRSEPWLAATTVELVPIASAGGEKQRRLLLIVGDMQSDGVPTDKHYLVNGFRHELIANLVRFREWSVIDGSGTAPAQSANALDGYYINAVAYPEGHGAKVILTLKDQHTSHYIWSDRYFVDLERWYEAQRGIIQRVAVALNVSLSAERLSKVASEADVSLPILDRWLRGQELNLLWRRKDETRGERIFRSIIKECPDFAPAYSSLVQILNSRHLIYPGIYRDEQRQREALELARKARELDPLDTKTQMSAAWSLAMNGRFDEAELGFQLAHDLNENEPWTLVSASLGLAFCGRVEQARAMADRILDIGLNIPPVYWAYQATTRFMCGEYEACIEAAERSADCISNIPGWKLAALALLGRTDEATSEAVRFAAMIQKQWYGPELANGTAIANWFLHCFPIREREALNRLREGFASAGMMTRT